MRVAQQRRRDAEPLPHPVRVAADAVLGAIAQLDDVEHLVDARARDAAVEIAEQPKVAATGEVGVEPRALRRSRRRRRAHGHRRRSGSRPKSRALPSVGRISPSSIRRDVVLPGAVRTEVAEDVAAVDGQVDMVHGDEVAVALDEPARFERRRVAHLSERAADSAAAVGIEPAST